MQSDHPKALGIVPTDDVPQHIESVPMALPEFGGSLVDGFSNPVHAGGAHPALPGILSVSALRWTS